MLCFSPRLHPSLILALMATCLSTPLAQADTPLPYQRIDFSTEVARETANDQINATLSIELNDKNAGQLSQQLTQAMNAAMKKASAYPTVKTSSGNQNTWPIYGTTVITSSSKLEGWRGRSEIRLESRDFKAAGELITALQETLQMNGISFSVAAETRQKLDDSLTAEAIAKFRARAETIRNAWGAKGYKLVQMNLNSAGEGGRPPMMAMYSKSQADAAPAQELAGGDTRIVVNISGSIELQP